MATQTTSHTPFDPNARAAADSGIFGLNTTEAQAGVVYLPVPWEVTTSYGGGTSRAPQAILAASHQVDLYDLDVKNPYSVGLFMRPESPEVRKWNEEGKALVDRIHAEDGTAEQLRVNELGSKLNEWVRAQVTSIFQAGKIPAVIGGDHSVPFGAFQAAAHLHPGLGLLHFDAHSDTRRAYEGFEWSHASILYNALTRVTGNGAIGHLTQVGIRDVCEQEVQFLAEQGKRVSVFYDRDLARAKMRGRPYIEIAREIAATLPQKVWITFDIDGLDPRFCPHTGTPVPGGLDLAEANEIFRAVVESGRTIVGFDLNEVAPAPVDHAGNPSSEWDANVGARLLYKLTGWTLASQKRAELIPLT